MSAIIWPERPICHGEAPRFAEDGVSWREPRKRSGETDPYEETFRTCSYCGSIHPEDLVAAIKQGARLGGSDWKYGWPHKFYVEGIPNPAVGQPIVTYTYCNRPPAAEIEAGQWQKYQDGFSRQTGEPQYSYRQQYGQPHPAPPTVHAKWYNEHLLDLSAEAFAVLAPLLLEKAGIQFAIEGGKLKYAAPHRGFQA